VTKEFNVNFEDSVDFVKDRLGHDKRYAISNEKLKKLGYSKYVSMQSGLDSIL
jgi:dTDP-glucose 4,6-dehydratase